MPITLDVDQDFADKLEAGQKIALRDLEGVILATLDVSDIYTPDKTKEAEMVFGTDDSAHPPRTLLRSLLVGAAATAVDLLALILLVELFGMDPRWANVPALTLGLAVQFVGNKYFAFQDHRPQVLRQGSLFLLVETGAFALNALAFHLLVTLATTPYLLARLVGAAVVYIGFSYPLWRLIFKPGALPATPQGLQGGEP